MSNPATAGLRDFFRKIWGDNEGYVYLPVKDNEAGKVKKFMLRWPEKEEAVYRHVLKWSATEGAEVFFSPAIYSRMRPRNEDVLGAQVAWVDFDNSFPATWPEDVAPIPSVEVMSSTERNRHAYWLLDSFKTAKEIENINRALAYALGADTSGWDANQFLRPPLSVNRKYRKPITVKVHADREEIALYSAEAFQHIPTPQDVIKAKIDLDDLPDMDEVSKLAKWDEDLLDLFNTTGDEAQGRGWDRSGGLARIAYKGAELGWQDDWIMRALLDADDRWRKYVGRSNRVKILEELINRARAKVGYDVDSDNSVLSKLLSRETESSVEDLPDFMSVGQINDIPGIDDWLIDGLLIPDGIGLFTGRPGTGKTQLALQLCGDLATGRSTFTDFDLPGEPKKVLFLSFEMSAYQLQHFTTKLVNSYPEKALNDNLTIYGRGEPVVLTSEQGQRLFDSWMDEYQPDVVIVDSLSQAATNISDDDEMKKLFIYLKALRRYHRFGMIFIHHHRKKANDAASRKQANSQSDIYGSYQISASVDFALDLEDRNDPEGLLDLTLLKARFRPLFTEPWKLRRNENLHFDRDELDAMRSAQIHDLTHTENGDDNDPEGKHLGL